MAGKGVAKTSNVDSTFAETLSLIDDLKREIEPVADVVTDNILSRIYGNIIYLQQISSHEVESS
jgi:hypothetical protein